MSRCRERRSGEIVGVTPYERSRGRKAPPSCESIMGRVWGLIRPCMIGMGITGDRSCEGFAVVRTVRYTPTSTTGPRTRSMRIGEVAGRGWGRSDRHVAPRSLVRKTPTARARTVAGPRARTDARRASIPVHESGLRWNVEADAPISPCGSPAALAQLSPPSVESDPMPDPPASPEARRRRVIHRATSVVHRGTTRSVRACITTRAHAAAPPRRGFETPLARVGTRGGPAATKTDRELRAATPLDRSSASREAPCAAMCPAVGGLTTSPRSSRCVRLAIPHTARALARSRLRQPNRRESTGGGRKNTSFRMDMRNTHGGAGDENERDRLTTASMSSTRPRNARVDVAPAARRAGTRDGIALGIRGAAAEGKGLRAKEQDRRWR